MDRIICIIFNALLCFGMSFSILAEVRRNPTENRMMSSQDRKIQQREELQRELNDKQQRLGKIEEQVYAIEKANIDNLPEASEAFEEKWKEFLESELFKKSLATFIIKELGITKSYLDESELEECKENIKQILNSFVNPASKIKQKEIGDNVTISVYMRYNEVGYFSRRMQTKVGITNITGKIKKFDEEAVYVITSGAMKKIPFTCIVESQRPAFDPSFAEEYEDYLSKNIRNRIQELNRLFRQLNFDSLVTGLEECRISRDYKKGNFFIRQYNLVQNLKDELVSWQFVLFQDVSDALKPFVLDKAIELNIENESSIDFRLKILDFNIIYSGYFDMLVDSPDQAEAWVIDKFDSFASPDFSLRRNKSMYLIKDSMFSKDAVNFKQLNEQKKQLEKEIDDLNLRIRNLEYDASFGFNFNY